MSQAHNHVYRPQDLVQTGCTPCGNMVLSDISRIRDKSPYTPTSEYRFPAVQSFKNNDFT